MSNLEKELAANFQGFRADWTAQANANWKALEPLDFYEKSYRRIACLHALKNEIVLPNFSEGSAAFFLEAHNDALVSHVNASFGAWRSSLQALRSCIENSLNAIYYRDHPIELELWGRGTFRMGFSDLLSYVKNHPKLSSFDNTKTGVQFLHDEYATLSLAVHASAVDFRMTDSAAAVLVWNTDKARAGKWSSREAKVIEGICLVFAFIFSEKLTGTQLSNLRSMLAFTVSDSKRTVLKKDLKITIPN
jgi:hypothetical protein